MKKLKIAAAFIFLTAASACSSPSANQSQLCVVSSVSAADNIKLCKAGQKIAFAPSSWGSEQLPILFASVNCDHRFSIAFTKGGVSCIFKPVEDVDDTTGN